MGLDVGQRRIGLAICDPDGILATPYSAITRKKLEDDIATIMALVEQEDVARIVVGLPISLDGSLGPQAHETIAFCDALRAGSPVPVETWDERYSTVEAEGHLRAAGVTPSRDRGRLDAAAAAVILQAYLDAHRERASRE